jgi:hypothetical protein
LAASACGLVVLTCARSEVELEVDAAHGTDFEGGTHDQQMCASSTKARKAAQSRKDQVLL